MLGFRRKCSATRTRCRAAVETVGPYRGSAAVLFGPVRRAQTWTFSVRRVCVVAEFVRVPGRVLHSRQRMMRFMLLFSRQGKLRLQKWYTATAERDKKKMVRELMQIVLARKPKMCSFLEWKDLKIVYKRYASLYFCCAIEEQDNELITLEVIHRFVELLDKYFGSVCELDIIFNFEKAYFILDEFLMGGEIQDTSKKSVLKAIEQADLLQEEDESPRSVLEEMGLA
uniref:Adaptor related protein complex 1 subunit sigma 1 n=5 Tax=Percomorphaceae TaxID=1489872 RepID=A0A3P9L048_ORYLA